MHNPAAGQAPRAPITTLPLPLTARSSATGIGILAYTLSDGTRHITLTRCADADRWTRICRAQMNQRAASYLRPELADWQSAWSADAQQAADCILQMFGMAWLNMARAKLRALGWTPRRAQMARAA